MSEIIDTTAVVVSEHGDTALVPASVSLERDPALVMREAVTAAKVLAEVIAGRKKKVVFGGETYIDAEGWLTVARFYGLTAKVEATRPCDYNGATGWEAEAVVLHVATGQIVGRAEAMCLNDEPNWKSKPQYQLRSMAQTRSCAKALRSVLAWVVVLAGFSPTPAEEMEGVPGTKVVDNVRPGQSPGGGGQRQQQTRGNDSRAPDEKQKLVTAIEATLLEDVGADNLADVLYTFSRFEKTDGSGEEMSVDSIEALQKISLPWLKKINFTIGKWLAKGECEHCQAGGTGKVQGQERPDVDDDLPF